MSKLLAWRKKEQVDLENILWVQGTPEHDYLEQWARALQVEDRLREALEAR